jgi:hypothetical protein
MTDIDRMCHNQVTLTGSVARLLKHIFNFQIFVEVSQISAPERTVTYGARH